MKKWFMFVIALCGLSAAQAVTVNWSTIDGSAASLKESYAFGDGLAFSFQSTDEVITSTFPEVGAAILKRISIIQRNSGGDVPTTVKLFEVDAGAEKYVAETTVVRGSKDIQMTFADGTTAVRNSTNLIFDVEVDVSKSYILRGYDANGDEMSIGASVVRDADNLEWIAAMRIIGEADTLNVPEPTALTLLALGVAGVALRRKKQVT